MLTIYSPARSNLRCSIPFVSRVCFDGMLDFLGGMKPILVEVTGLLRDLSSRLWEILLVTFHESTLLCRDMRVSGASRCASDRLRAVYPATFMPSG